MVKGYALGPDFLNHICETNTRKLQVAINVQGFKKIPDFVEK